MTLEQIIDKLQNVIEELKATYVEKLNDAAGELLAGLEDGGKEGAEKVRELVDVSVKEFQADLEKVLNDLELKVKKIQAGADRDLEEVAERAEKDIQTGFAGIFETIYAKLKGLFRG